MARCVWGEGQGVWLKGKTKGKIPKYFILLQIFHIKLNFCNILTERNELPAVLNKFLSF